MTKMKVLFGAAVCAASVVGMSGVAFAGEWAPGGGTNGHTTPPHDHIAASVCSFSGADESDATEDHHGGAGDDGLWASTPSGGKAQSGGQIVAGLLQPMNETVAAGVFNGFGVNADQNLFNPESCNPNVTVNEEGTP